jgi:predicted methyltransferase
MFLEIFLVYMKRQIEVVPVCIGLGLKQIYCVAHKDKIVYVDVDLHVVDIYQSVSIKL